MLLVKPGDVLLTRDGSLGARIIRFGAKLVGKPATWNHVIVAHHVDDAGTYWGVQGQPGVVSYVDMAHALADRWTLTNVDQPKTMEQRDMVCAIMAAMVSGEVSYDWSAIVMDAVSHVDPLWHLRTHQWDSGGEIPAHVVCSSAADFAYEHAELASPHADRYATPSDWAIFILSRGWTLAA